MRTNFLILSILLAPVLSIGQDSLTIVPFRNTLFVDFMGQGIGNSFSFDRLFLSSRNTKSSFSAGFTFLPFGKGEVIYGIPIAYNVLIGKNKHHLEIGAGASIIFFKAVRHSYFSYYNHGMSRYGCMYVTPRLGYRFQNPKGGIFFRATLTPIVGIFNTFRDLYENTKFDFLGDYNGISPEFYPWFGISLGYTLKN